MINVIDKYIDYVDDNYHMAITEDDIRNITGYSSRYFNKRFKEMFGITPNKYRMRRQLYLIALDIKMNSYFVKGSDVFPWADNVSFSKAFKREFNITPYEYSIEKHGILQEKIKIKKEKYLENNTIVNQKICEREILEIEKLLKGVQDKYLLLDIKETLIQYLKNYNSEILNDIYD